MRQRVEVAPGSHPPDNRKMQNERLKGRRVLVEVTQTTVVPFHGQSRTKISVRVPRRRLAGSR